MIIYDNLYHTFALSFHNELDINYRHYPPLLRKAILFFRTQYSDPQLSVVDAAAHCGISEQYLRLFFRQAGLPSPRKYLAIVRCEAAKDLLHDQRYSLSYIASMTGFLDQYYFSTCFKKIEGMPPGQYRQ